MRILTITIAIDDSTHDDRMQDDIITAANEDEGISIRAGGQGYEIEAFMAEISKPPTTIEEIADALKPVGW